MSAYGRGDSCRLRSLSVQVLERMLREPWMFLHATIRKRAILTQVSEMNDYHPTAPAKRTTEEPRLLSSWKDIAEYLGRGIRTAQRWEQSLGLPVRRPTGATCKSTVAVQSEEIDAWLATRFAARPLLMDEAGPQQTALARADLRERLRKSHELRTRHQDLTDELKASIQKVSQQCIQLSANTTSGAGALSRATSRAATAQEAAKASFSGLVVQS